MDNLLPLLTVIFLGGNIIFVVLLLKRRRAPDNQTDMPAQILGEMRGQISEIGRSHSDQQKAQAEQMAALSKRLEDSLSGMSQRMGQSLQSASERTHENLTKMSERLAVIDKANSHIAELTGQVTQLHNILANKTDRGTFGEVQLENLVETVLPPNAYEFQVTLSNQKRADCVLKLPQPQGNIIIDAKFPLESWHMLQSSGDDAARKAARKQLGADVLRHVRDISEKYIIAGETSDSACLFLPSEAVYAELHANMLDIVEKSYAARVWIVSPTTMMATLNTVRAILRDARMQEQTAVIQKEIGVLVTDVNRLDDRVKKLDQHFTLAQRDIQDIRTSTGKITRRGQRIEDYDVDDNAPDVSLSGPAVDLLGGGFDDEPEPR